MRRLVRLVAGLAAIGLCGAAVAENSPAQVVGVIFDPTVPGNPIVSVTGTPAVVRVSRWPWDGAPEPICVVFRVRAERLPFDVEVSTIGLGRTVLAAVPGASGACTDAGGLTLDVPRCANSAQTGSIERLVLPVRRAPSVDWTVTARVDASPLAADGTSMDGQVVVVAKGRGATAVPLKMERLPLSPWLTAGAWFLGLLVPAAITFGVTVLINYLTARQKANADARAAREKELADFQTYRLHLGSMATIGEFFDHQLPAARQAGAQRPCEWLFEWMYLHAMLVKVPHLELDRLRRASDSENRADFLALLRELFPERRASMREDWS